MKSAIAALMTVLLLASCAPVSSKALPDVVEYSKKTQKQAAIELETCGPPTVMGMMTDYKVMRDQTRALRK